MTVSTTEVQKAYTGNNSTTAFPTTFEFWDTDELEVYLRVISTGVETPQTEITHYTVTGGAGETGTVNFITAPTTLQEAHIRRVSDTTQYNDITSATTVPNAAIEESLDRAAMRDQEDRSDFSQRALRIPVTDIPVSGTAPDMELPSKVDRAVANAVLGFDQVTGDPVVVTGATLPSVTVTVFGASLVDDIDAAAGRTTLVAIENGGQTEAINVGALPALKADSLTFDTDSRRIWHQDSGFTLTEYVVQQIPASSVPGAATSPGKLYYEKENGHWYFDNGVTIAKGRSPLSRGDLNGLNITLTRTDFDVNISPGAARAGTASDRDLVNAILETGLVKQMEAVGGWVEGTNAAGRPSADALGAGKWHHVFLLAKPDGSVDAGFDDELEAVKLLGEATGYTRFRYIWSVKETSAGDGTLEPFIQIGDQCIWTTIPGLDYDDTVNANYSGADNNISLSWVPPDISVEVDLTVSVLNLATVGLLAHGGTTIGADPTQLVSPLANIEGSTNTIMKRWTDTSQQVVYRDDDGSSQLNIEVHGFRNPRGRWQ